MTRFGYFLASEEHGPKELVRQARAAEEAGFDALWRLVDRAPAYAISYGSTDAATALIDELWAAHG